MLKDDLLFQKIATILFKQSGMKNNNLTYVVSKGVFTYHFIKHNFSFRSSNFYINILFSV